MKKSRKHPIKPAKRLGLRILDALHERREAVRSGEPLGNRTTIKTSHRPSNAKRPSPQPSP